MKNAVICIYYMLGSHIIFLLLLFLLLQCTYDGILYDRVCFKYTKKCNKYVVFALFFTTRSKTDLPLDFIFTG